jgi:ankyrin repeat protein
MKVHFAAWTGDKESAEMLVRQGEDITVPDSYGWTALHLAVWNMHADMVIFLLEVVDQMMWISTQNQDGISALHLATCNNDVEIKILLNAGADKYVQDHDGLMPVHWAAKNGHVDASKH